jgi:hypothetical protein
MRVPESRYHASKRRAVAGAALLALTAAAPLAAQGYPFSQRGTVSQHIALTSIEIEYGRPTARGRALFGALVPWDSVWHPGADSATHMSIDHDIVLEGHPVRAGEYSLWLIPRARAPWTVILNRTAHTFHKPYPGSATDVLRFDVAPKSASHVETLMISFPMVLRDEGTLRIQWGETAVDLAIKAPFKPD